MYCIIMHVAFTCAKTKSIPVHLVDMHFTVCQGFTVCCRDLVQSLVSENAIVHCTCTINDWYMYVCVRACV